ncbi:MAG: PAS domain-containing protein [Anaerolineae bacterium]|nr:PAS domain-containing protein [Anaerolineae bacterium]
MGWQYTPYFFPLIAGALISLGLAIFAWRHRSTPGATSFAALMGCVACWSLGYAIQLSFIAMRAKVIQSNINYTAIFVVPLTWLAFALQYTGHEKWLTRRNLASLSVIPIILLGIIWTDSWHRWFRTDIELVAIGGKFVVMQPTHGVAFWAFAAYAYSLILLGTGLILRNLIGSASVYRSQAIVITVGTLIPLAANALSIFHLVPFSGIDLTPFSFVLTGAAMAWGIFRYQLLDVVPVAHDTIIENMRDSVIVLDAQKRIVDLNPAAQKLLGRPPSQIIGRPSREVLTAWPALAEYAQDIIEAHAEIALDKEGAQRFFDLRISPLRGLRGGPAGRLIVLRDITVRKRAESELNATLESIADGVIVFDAAGRATIANAAATDLLGTREDEIVGSDIREVMIGVVAQVEQAVINAALESNSLSRSSIKIPWGQKTLSVSAAPVRLDSGEVIGSVAVLRDFTHEAEVDRMKSTFVSIASHELRAPLNAILGYTEMLREGVFGSLTGEQHDAVKRVLANTNQMMSLANNLLDQARMEAGKLSLTLSTFSPANLVDGVRQMMEITAHTKNIDLVSHVAADVPPTITGDFQRLQQILVNLTSNAIKFTDEGSVSLCAYKPDLDHWALAVSDTGCGISEEGQKIVFEPFRRGEEVAHKYGGAGLGLSIAKQLVELMGGEIQLESKVGKGSTFTVVLPIRPT